jgi:hypothetical protein
MIFLLAPDILLTNILKFVFQIVKSFHFVLLNQIEIVFKFYLLLQSMSQFISHLI